MGLVTYDIQHCVGRSNIWSTYFHPYWHLRLNGRRGKAGFVWCGLTLNYMTGTEIDLGYILILCLMRGSGLETYNQNIVMGAIADDCEQCFRGGSEVIAGDCEQSFGVAGMWS